MKLVHLLIVFIVCSAVAVECLQFSVDYAEKAFKKCKAAGRKIERSRCSILQDAIESYIDNMGVQLAEKMGFSLADVDKNAKQPAFVTSGNKILDEMVQYLIDNPKAPEKDIQTQFSTKFFKWWIDLLKNEPPLDWGKFNFDGKGLPEEIKQQLKKKAAEQAASGHHHMPPKRPTKPAKPVDEDEELEEKIEL